MRGLHLSFFFNVCPVIQDYIALKTCRTSKQCGINGNTTLVHRVIVATVSVCSGQRLLTLDTDCGDIELICGITFLLPCDGFYAINMLISAIDFNWAIDLDVRRGFYSIYIDLNMLLSTVTSKVCATKVVQ